jgi:hypothetical protein
MNTRAHSSKPDRHREAAWLVPVTIRLAARGDEPALARLAARDSRAMPAGPHLISERGGAVEAALSLRTGEVVADPFVRTAELVELLRCHAAGARVAHEPAPGYSAPGRPARHLRPRLAGAGGCA